LGQQARDRKINFARISREIGHFLASAAAPKLRPRCVHAKSQIRPAGPPRRISPEDCSSFRIGNLLFALSAEAAVKYTRLSSQPFQGDVVFPEDYRWF